MRTSMIKIIDGIRYNTETARVIASDEYWDGHNFERGGTNQHLYRSKTGRYFAGHSTQWQGSRASIEALSEEEAKHLYETLQEHEEEYEDAFPGATVVEA